MCAERGWGGGRAGMAGRGEGEVEARLAVK